jgi:cytochrome c oxidase assembly factor CtaG
MFRRVGYRRAVWLGLGAGAVVLVAPPTAAAHGSADAGWRFEPLPLVLAVASLALVAGGIVRLRRRGRPDLAPVSRLGLFAVAVALVLLVLCSPVGAAGEDELLSVHMLQHVVLGDLAPALAVVALRGALLFFVVPPLVLRAFSRTPALRRPLAFLVRPLTSYLVWLAALVVWHVPVVYDFAAGNPVGHDLQHVSFLVGGLLIWTQLVDPARRRALSTDGRLFFLLAVFAAGQALAITLVAQPDPIYATYAHLHEGRFGLTPAADQDYAGIVMMLEQFLTLGVCAAFLIREHLRGATPPPEGTQHPLAL